MFSGRTILATTSDRRAPHRIELQPFSVYVPASKITLPFTHTHTHACVRVWMWPIDLHTHVNIWIFEYAVVENMCDFCACTVDGGQLTKKKKNCLFGQRCLQKDISSCGNLTLYRVHSEISTHRLYTPIDMQYYTHYIQKKCYNEKV